MTPIPVYRQVGLRAEAGVRDQPAANRETTSTTTKLDLHYFARFHQHRYPQRRVAWSASRCPMLRADWRTFGVVVSKLGLQAILNKAQKNQMEDHSSIIDSLKLVVEEMEEAANGGQTGKTQGIRQLVDTMKRISDERRELEVGAKTAESTVEQMEHDKLEMITVGAEKEIGMKNELAELRGTCRPIPCSCCGPGI